MDLVVVSLCCFFFFKQKTAYEMRISDWSSDVCSSDLDLVTAFAGVGCYARIETAFGDGAAGGLQSGNGLGDAPRDQPCGEADDDHADREQQQRVDAPHVRAARRRLYGHPAQASPVLADDDRREIGRANV